MKKRDVKAAKGSLGALVLRFRTVYFGHGLTYNAHNWTGVEITSDSLRNIKRAAKALGWKQADISRSDGLPEWVSRDGWNASETYLWMRRRVFPQNATDHRPGGAGYGASGVRPGGGA